MTQGVTLDFDRGNTWFCAEGIGWIFGAEGTGWILTDAILGFGQKGQTGFLGTAASRKQR
jgi:hypothetical protein